MSQYDIFLRLFTALLLSGVIGFDRERTNKPAGLRTHVLVGVGSALFMVCASWISNNYQPSEVSMTQVAAQIVTGIGFLGAGVIIQAGGSVHGLTTAASLWMVAGVGLASGLGFYSGAVWGTFFAMITLVLLNTVETLLKTHGLRLVSLHITAQEEAMNAIEQEVQSARMKLTEFSLIEQSKRRGILQVTVKDISRARARELIDKLWLIKGIQKIEWI